MDTSEAGSGNEIVRNRMWIKEKDNRNDGFLGWITREGTITEIGGTA